VQYSANLVKTDGCGLPASAFTAAVTIMFGRN